MPYTNPYRTTVKPRRVLSRSSSSSPAPSPSPQYAPQSNHEQIIVGQAQQEHDELLVEMQTIVARLGDMSHAMGEELIGHDIALEQLREDIAESNTRMDTLNRRMDRLLQRSRLSRCKLIIILAFILFVLVLLILYT